MGIRSAATTSRSSCARRPGATAHPLATAGAPSSTPRVSVVISRSVMVGSGSVTVQLVTAEAAARSA
ncbi:hypothetical protein OHB26_05645 [Nocardia sp. NBC_01503]|uniref:hypothetical protein n=1 Tax=Nocardia sp. NBC_01503 TaxID=2975997 RepID=UPI002E7BC416|nr:hypothetical protein [Nocardia sp. NBC_01503]WTL33707.1 hypothetical protein OHB26_05645 [Nocardia sp. NBC_01503]